MNYVRFLKGSPDAYRACEKQDDTLYFVYTSGSTTGKLYLGNILISNGATEEGPIPENVIDTLAELLDVDVTLKEEGQVLGYDGEKWVPMTLPEAATSSIMTGATATTDGAAGLVPAPQAGDENKFLRGDGKWVEVATSDVDLTEYAKKTEVETMLNELDDDFVNTSEVEAITTKITELEGEHDAIQDSITWGSI